MSRLRRYARRKKWDKLPDVLKEIAALREEYPEDSLKELGEKTDPPIGKSGVNHRLNRIIEMADNL
ncbi:MAG: DNA-binding protein WhiA [Clostridia bacterium]|nr:DNA-binding protein WhiA [Clostridia bacterium]